MMTPVHPLCDKQGPLTSAEMVEMIECEGLVGIGLPADIRTAEHLHSKGALVLTTLHGTPHIVARDRRNSNVAA